MLRNIMMMTTLATGLFLQTNLAEARTFVVGISPFLGKTPALKQARQVNGFILKTLAPGDDAVVFDAYKLKTIAKYSVPNKPGYNHLRIKLRINAKAVSAVNQFAAQSHAPSGAGQPRKSNAIKFPEFVRFVGNTYPAQSLDIVVFGSPLYPSPSSPAFTMETGRVPGDGHLFHSVGTTVFGVDNPSALKNKRIHWYTGGSSWAEHAQHWHVARFWSLFCSRQSGMLSSFSDDLSTIMARAKAHTASPNSHFPPIQKTRKLEMLRIRKPVLQTSESIYNRPITPQKPPQSMIAHAGNVEFGLRWYNCNACDLDLYVKPAPNAQMLYYNRTATPYGTYIKDFRSSPKHFFETVQLSKPVNLNHTLVAVNYYDGQNASPITGELRISWQGKTYKKPFKILARKGNCGANKNAMLRTKQAPSNHWIVFNIPQILGQ